MNVSSLVAETGLLFLLGAMPFFYGAVYPWAGMTAAAVFFLLFSLRPSAVFRLGDFSKIPLFGLLSVLAWVLAQSLFYSADRYGTSLEFLKWAAAGCGFLLVMDLPVSSVKKMIWVLIAAGILESAYGLSQVISGSEKVLGTAKTAHLGYVTGTYWNRNHLAGFLEICFPLHLGLWIFTWRKRRYGASAWAGFSLFVVCVAFVKTGSRAGIFALAAGALLSSVLAPNLRPRLGKWGVLLAAMMGVGVLLLGANAIFSRFVDSVTRDFGAGERWAIWQDAFRMLSAYWRQGIGLGSFEWVFPAYQSAYLVWSYAHAHNDYLELLVSLGVPAFTVLVLSFVGMWETVSRTPVSRDDGTFPEELRWGCLTGMIALLVHACFDFNLAIPANMFLWVLLTAVFFRTRFPEERKKIPAGHAAGPIRFAAAGVMLILCFFSARAGWADLWAYRSENYLRRGEEQKAARLAGIALRIEPSSPDILRRAGKIFRATAIKNNDPESFSQAARVYERLTKEVPVYGRGWYFLGASRLAALPVVGRADWLGNKKFFFRAWRLEPSSEWVAYNVAATFVRYDSFLSPHERRFAFRLMKQACRTPPAAGKSPYLDSPSLYLKPALSWLWKRYADFALLKWVVPVNAVSYGIFLDFLGKEGLWLFRPEIDAVYEKLALKAYRQFCDEGDEHFSKKDFRGAFRAYRKGLWTGGRAGLRAQAGVIASLEAMGKLKEIPEELFRQSYRSVLKRTLEEEDESQGRTLAGLEGAVIRTGEPYLAGLYALRMKRFPKAVRQLEGLGKSPEGRRYLAEAYAGDGRPEKAVETLLAAREEKDPDLRELFLLLEWVPGEAPVLWEKIRRVEKNDIGERKWFGPPVFASRGFRECTVNFRPGALTLRIPVRHTSGENRKGAFITVKINERFGTSAYLDGDGWQFVEVPFVTTGGKRRIRVDFLNGETPGSAIKGPSLELGDPEVAYPGHREQKD
jgi:O-antigen ligase/tetratricopeptide (TPR) repeat protein